MILSRARSFSRATGSVVNVLLQGNYGINFKQASRTKSWIQYRNVIPPDDYLKQSNKPFVILSGALWWWFLWKCVSEYEVLLGPNIPKMSEWTDEELGIPPLDEDP